ncbi:MAG: iron ABC transporter permease [Muribaculaceae bacterium]|nr:iron ABC transporter permease [Muribaculaceae bacterium]
MCASHPKSKNALAFLFLLILAVILFGANLVIGSVHIPFGKVMDALFGNGEVESTVRFIILDSRLPASITALLAGSSLAVCGLMMQSAFRNPLAGPSVLGVNSGASLGVALVMLLWGGTFRGTAMGAGGISAVMVGAFAGAMCVMGIIILLSNILRNPITLIIAGMMIGYLVSSIITLLNFEASAQGVQSYVMWGMGSFGGQTRETIIPFAILTCAGLVFSLLLVKPLDLLLLGEAYAKNLGLNLTLTRNLLLIATGVLSAVTTAYCGPVSFLGLAIPHITRLLFPTDLHRLLMPACILMGGVVAMLCNLLCIIPRSGVLPLNAVTPLIGAPVIIWVILKSRR